MRQFNKQKREEKKYIQSDQPALKTGEASAIP
jgi:hypothetical protein